MHTTSHWHLFKKKVSRTVWRASHPKRAHHAHGGRGKKYGLKSGKQKKHKRSSQ